MIQLNMFLKSIISPKPFSNSSIYIGLQCFFSIYYDLFYFIGFKIVSNILLIYLPILETIFTNVLWMLEKKAHSQLVGNIHPSTQIFHVCFRSIQTPLELKWVIWMCPKAKCNSLRSGFNEVGGESSCLA